MCEIIVIQLFGIRFFSFKICFCNCWFRRTLDVISYFSVLTLPAAPDTLPNIVIWLVIIFFGLFFCFNFSGCAGYLTQKKCCNLACNYFFWFQLYRLRRMIDLIYGSSLLFHDLFFDFVWNYFLITVCTRLVLHDL